MNGPLTAAPSVISSAISTPPSYGLTIQLKPRSAATRFAWPGFFASSIACSIPSSTARTSSSFHASGSRVTGLMSFVVATSVPRIQMSTEIVAAEAAIGDDNARPIVLAHAQAALGRWLAHDPQAGVALRRQTEALQTWVAVHPKDSLAWTLLSQCAEPLGQKLRAIRAEAESHAARGDVIGALDRLRAGQRAAREANADFVEASIIDARTRELEAQRRELVKEFGEPR